MAPEILENKSYTHKADVYSYGVSSMVNYHV
jgi:serine/threonine protein kinase